MIQRLTLEVDIHVKDEGAKHWSPMRWSKVAAELRLSLHGPESADCSVYGAKLVDSTTPNAPR